MKRERPGNLGAASIRVRQRVGKLIVSRQEPLTEASKLDVDLGVKGVELLPNAGRLDEGENGLAE